jgi:hypothetical protein
VFHPVIEVVPGLSACAVRRLFRAFGGVLRPSAELWDLFAVFLAFLESGRNHDIVGELRDLLFLPEVFTPSQTAFGPIVAPKSLVRLRRSVWNIIRGRAEMVKDLLFAHRNELFC